MTSIPSHQSQRSNLVFSNSIRILKQNIIEIHNFVKKEDNERVSRFADERTLKKGSPKGSKKVRSATIRGR